MQCIDGSWWPELCKLKLNMLRKYLKRMQCKQEWSVLYVK